MTKASRRRGGPHVLIIVQNLSVPLDRRVWLECQTLVRAGYRVSVICPRGAGDSSYTELDGVRIHRYAPAPAARGILAYGFEFAYCWLRALVLTWRIHRAEPLAVIQGCNPPDTYWALALLFRRAGVRFVFDHHDLCPELYDSKPGEPSRWVRWLLRWLERRTFATADLVLTTNESYRERASARTDRPADEIVVVRSGPDPAKMRRGTPEPDLRNGRTYLACYLGVMNPQDGVDVVVRAADHLVHGLGRDDVQVALLGDGDCGEELRRQASALGLDDYVTFTGMVGSAEIERWLSTADVGLSPDPYTVFNDVSTMNKTLEYMAYGLPVLAFRLTETAVSAGPAGEYVAVWSDEGDEAHRFGDALIGLLDDPERRATMGAAGRERIEKSLGWPASAAVYLAAYDRLTGRHLSLVSAA
ncbi:MAG: hypothetical protein QOD92_1919 [Acidimicrobiaceae bacterium]